MQGNEITNHEKEVFLILKGYKPTQIYTIFMNDQEITKARILWAGPNSSYLETFDQAYEEAIK